MSLIKIDELVILDDETIRNGGIIRKNLKENSDNKRLMAHSLVGTPNYIAPEILLRQGNALKPYN